MVDASQLAEFGVWFVVFLFSLTLHEGAHALLARLGGDDTAYLGGQVTLSPLPHIRREPVGTILVPILSFFFAGWMMGWASTPYDPDWARRHPLSHALMSFAGPCGNLLIAILSFVTLKILLGSSVYVQVQAGELSLSHLVTPNEIYGPDSLLHPAGMALSIALSLNVLLFVFNLLPLPPMDGSGILQGLFPTGIGRLIDLLRANPMMSLLGLLAAWQIFPSLFFPVMRAVLGLLYAGS